MDKPRNYKQSKEQIDQKIQSIYLELLLHVGEPVIFFKKESRKIIPYFLVLKSVHGKNSEHPYAIAIQNCYNPDGGFRGNITHMVDIIKILTGEQRVVFFDEDI